MSKIPIIERLNIHQVERGQISRFWLELTTGGLGNPLRVPLLVARGWEDGPVLGVTAVIHGNALNGLPVVRQLFQYLDMNNLCGTVVGIPVMNMPGFLQQERQFLDGVDLNRIMPGRKGGSISEMYTFRLMDRVISSLDYLVDIQTADFGQLNSFFVRADLNKIKPAIMARLFNPDVILHDPGDVGTLRRAATDIDIQAITVVAGGPHRFQRDVIFPARDGLINLLTHLDMQENEIEPAHEIPIECRNAYWINTQQSGILEVYPDAGDLVKRGEKIGRLTNVFGDLLCEYSVSESGIVLSKSVNPVSQAGDLILYLGVPRQKNGRN